MKIQRSGPVVQRLAELFDIKRANDIINMELFSLTEGSITVLEEPDRLESYVEWLMTQPKVSALFRDRQAAYIYTFVRSMLQSVGRRLDSDLLEAIMIRIANEGRVFSKADLADDPYYKNIVLPEKLSGSFKLGSQHYDAYELAAYDVYGFDRKRFLMLPRLCYFSERFDYPSISEKRGEGFVTWMSVTPNEIFTMRKHIEAASGRVLTLGCGMGYYAYLVSNKENVESVTIIEREQSVIELFTENILPQFEHRDKIKLIKADAFDYINTISDGEFDCCFADIWVGAMDTETYCRLKAACRRFRKMKMSYWIEEAFIFNFRGYLFLALLEHQAKQSGMPFDKPALPELPGEYTKRYYEELVRKIDIRLPDDIENTLRPENILKAINKIKL